MSKEKMYGDPSTSVNKKVIHTHRYTILQTREYGSKEPFFGLVELNLANFSEPDDLSPGAIDSTTIEGNALLLESSKLEFAPVKFNQDPYKQIIFYSENECRNVLTNRKITVNFLKLPLNKHAIQSCNGYLTVLDSDIPPISINNVVSVSTIPSTNDDPAYIVIGVAQQEEISGDILNI